MKKIFDSINFWIIAPNLLLLLIALLFNVAVSYRDNQVFAHKSFERLSNQISQEVNRQINSYLADALLLNKLNENSISLEQLNFDSSNKEKVLSHFSQLLLSFRQENDETMNSVYYGRINGDFWGAEYFPERNVVVAMRSGVETGNKFTRYPVDQESGKAMISGGAETDEEFQLKGRPWYDMGIDGKTGWSPVYIDYTTNKPVLTAVKPISDQNGERKGVLASDVLFEEIENFLKIVLKDFSKNGLIFIINSKPDSVYELIVTSKGHKTYVDQKDNGEIQPLPASKISSINPNYSTNQVGAGDRLKNQALDLSYSARLIAQISQTFEENTNRSCQNFNTKNSIATIHNFEGSKYFVETSSIENATLSWCVFLAIPESDLIQDFGSAKRISWGAYLVFGGVIAALSIFASSKIVKPIKELTESVRNLSDSIPPSNNFPNIEFPKNKITHPLELGQLAKDFKNMKSQLDRKFVEVKEKSDRIEEAKQEKEKANLELEAKNRELKETSEKLNLFVSQEFLNVLEIKKTTEIELGKNVERKMSILFSDIRSFTNLSTNMSPKDNFDFINAYLKRMEPAILENNGFIDKYIGDAIMALFDGTKSGLNSIEAALSMLTRLKEYNNKRISEDRSPIDIGIGIHTGDLMLGMIGGDNRIDGTVISSDVNLASRLEGLTKYFGASLIVSEKTLLHVGENKRKNYDYRYLGPVTPKGTRDAVRIYEIFNNDESNLKSSKIENKEKFEEALALSLKMEHEKSREIFESIQQKCSQDKAVEYFIKACQEKKDFGKEFGAK